MFITKTRFLFQVLHNYFVFLSVLLYVLLLLVASKKFDGFSLKNLFVWINWISYQFSVNFLIRKILKNQRNISYSILKMKQPSDLMVFPISFIFCKLISVNLNFWISQTNYYYYHNNFINKYQVKIDN